MPTALIFFLHGCTTYRSILHIQSMQIYFLDSSTKQNWSSYEMDWNDLGCSQGWDLTNADRWTVMAALNTI